MSRSLALYEAKRAKVLKAQIEAPLQTCAADPKMNHTDFERIRSDAYQARDAARYFAEHYAQDRRAFLRACGLQAEARDLATH